MEQLAQYSVFYLIQVLYIYHTGNTLQLQTNFKRKMPATIQGNGVSYNAVNNIVHQQTNQQYQQADISCAAHYTTPEVPVGSSETQNECSHTDIDFEGWLFKQASWLKDWRKRYFRLSGSKLFISKDLWKSPHSMIDLGLATAIQSSDIRKNAFQIITHDAVYTVHADSEEEKDAWIGNLAKRIVRKNENHDIVIVESDMTDRRTAAKCDRGQDRKEDEDYFIECDKGLCGKEDDFTEDVYIHPLFMMHAFLSDSTE
jgi:hypothetical protein